MTETIEILESEYIALIDQNKKLQAKVDKYELCIFGMMRQLDKLLVEEQNNE
jgi:hypothetical protein